jgi:transglutaminase-like putative cysteine protease
LREGVVRQQFTIEPLSQPTLFSCTPLFVDAQPDTMTYFPVSGRIDRLESARTRRFTYELLTTAFRRHRQTDLLPISRPVPNQAFFLQLPANGPAGDPLARLKATAADIVSKIPKDDIVGRAKALETYLRDSGRFQYTLQTPVRPVGVDPLEDFVASNPRGHCEYFAGALALMLRSVLFWDIAGAIGTWSATSIRFAN